MADRGDFFRVPRDVLAHVPGAKAEGRNFFARGQGDGVVRFDGGCNVMRHNLSSGSDYGFFDGSSTTNRLPPSLQTRSSARSVAPRLNSLAWSASVTGLRLISEMTSPGFSPARAAAEPGSTLTTTAPRTFSGISNWLRIRESRLPTSTPSNRSLVLPESPRPLPGRPALARPAGSSPSLTVTVCSVPARSTRNLAVVPGGACDANSR